MAVGEETIRLQKVLSERGVASRRKAAALIEQGAVKVNGRTVTEPGARVSPAGCAIEVLGAPLAPAAPVPRTIAFYKPRGYICSRAGGQGRTIYELLDRDGHSGLLPVGRLDKDSEGLLLLTNDGDLLHRLTHPRHGHRKTYRVTVTGHVSARQLATLRSRMVVDGYRIRPVEVDVLDARGESDRAVLRLTMSEGRNRQIRNMCARAGLRIRRLVRTDIDGLSVDGLRPGQWRDIRPSALGPRTTEERGGSATRAGGQDRRTVPPSREATPPRGHARRTAIGG